MILTTITNLIFKVNKTFSEGKMLQKVPILILCNVEWNCSSFCILSPPCPGMTYSGMCSQCVLLVRLCVMCCIIIGGKIQHIQSTFNDINRAIMWFCPLVALSANLTTFTANLKKSNSNRKDIMAALECGVEGSGEKSSIEYCRYYWLSKATKDPIFLSRNDTIIARQNPDIQHLQLQLHTHTWNISHSLLQIIHSLCYKYC